MQIVVESLWKSTSSAFNTFTQHRIVRAQNIWIFFLSFRKSKTLIASFSANIFPYLCPMAGLEQAKFLALHEAICVLLLKYKTLICFIITLYNGFSPLLYINFALCCFLIFDRTYDRTANLNALNGFRIVKSKIHVHFTYDYVQSIN